MNLRDDWVEHPPDDIESQVFLLDAYANHITEKTPRGETLRHLFENAKSVYREALQHTQQNEPQAFFKPSYEQALLLNAWAFGFTFPICFSANRIGKTTGFAFNAILWLYPNNPQWICFQPYIDFLGRRVEILQRPSLDNLLELQAFYEQNPHLVGDPYHLPTDDCNVAKWTEVQRQVPHLVTPCYPYPPIPRGGQIWLGAPDNDFHKRIIMRRWRELLPKASILKDSETDRMFVISTASTTNPKTTAHEIVCKSYESQETKWSGDAVHGIVLTEGFEQDILNELKNRITNNGFASWDYTPTEPRNTGRKTYLAYKVYKQIEELPLRQFTFIKFSVRNAPEHIIPKQKKADLIRMWEGKPEGDARLEGDFFSSSGLVLDKLDRNFHCLDWSLQKLFEQFPNGRFYRALDPGLDHPTACAWGYLSTSNIWFIYRFYSKRGATISQRCDDIITLSNNKREKTISRGGQTIWREVHPYPDSEVFTATVADFHLFKQDEVTGQNYALNYNLNGLVVTESTHVKPEQRATTTNNKLDPSSYRFNMHPQTMLPPGAGLFFLTSQPGVAAALDKFEQLFWERYKSGDNKGEPKDKVPIHGDDELDALSYLTASPYVWTRHTPQRREPQERLPGDQLTDLVATLQLEQHAGFQGGFR